MSEEEIIQYLKNENGIEFELITPEDSVQYIKESTYYHKLSEYKKNFPNINGKYIKLDFMYLIELCKLDKELRYIIFGLCMDLEHFLKNRIVRMVGSIIENTPSANPVREYLEINNKAKSIILSHADKKTSYISHLVRGDSNDYPVWEFVELASFGSLVSFCDFIKTKHSKSILSTKVLNNVRDLRNAVAHNNCVLTDFVSLKQVSLISEIASFVSGFGLGQKTRKNNITNKFVHDFLCLCYAHKMIVNDSRKFVALKQFWKTRMILHSEYFITNSRICRTYKFLKIIVDNI